MAEYREAFREFDTDGDGTISREELRTMMNRLGEDVTEQELNDIIASTDANNDGEIDFEEFAICMSKWASTDPQDQLKQCFQIMDEDGNGSISMAELRLASSKIMKEQWDDKVIEELIRESELDGNGEIDYDEFCKLMKSYEKKAPVAS